MTATARDPVCGALVDTAKGKGRREEYKKTSYYFCSDTCQHRFRESPEDYLTWHA